MKSLFYRAGGAIAAGALLAATATPVLAENDAKIIENGNGSNNTITISSTCNASLIQRNNTDVGVALLELANTGGNSANANTGGDVEIDTGQASASATVTVGGSTNTGEVPDCCECETSGSAVIRDNGNNSSNSITKRAQKRTRVKQKNRTRVRAGGALITNTGKNKARKNTGGNVTIKTRKADVFFDIFVEPASND